MGLCFLKSAHAFSYDFGDNVLYLIVSKRRLHVFLPCPLFDG